MCKWVVCGMGTGLHVAAVVRPVGASTRCVGPWCNRVGVSPYINARFAMFTGHGGSYAVVVGVFKCGGWVCGAVN